MILLLTEGQVSDYRGAATVLTDLPDAEVLIADLLPENWTKRSWNFPFMIPRLGEGEFYEAKQVHRGADSVCFEAG